MKKTVFSLILMFMFVLCCGCSNTDSTQSNAQSSSGNNTTSSTVVADENNNTIPELDFDTYNILSAEPSERGAYIDSIGYEQKIVITNNGSQVVSDISITVCYYDADGNIIYNDSRGPGVSLESGQSINITSYCPEEYKSCSVTNYMYSTPNKIQGEYDSVDVDVVAETITGYYTP